MYTIGIITDQKSIPEKKGIEIREITDEAPDEPQEYPDELSSAVANFISGGHNVSESAPEDEIPAPENAPEPPEPPVPPRGSTSLDEPDSEPDSEPELIIRKAPTKAPTKEQTKEPTKEPTKDSPKTSAPPRKPEGVVKLEGTTIKYYSAAGFPFSKTKGNAGFDLYADIDEAIVLPPLSRKTIPTGLFLEFPENLRGHVCAKSSLAILGIDVGAGTVDSIYRGEIGVLLINGTNKTEFVINPGDKIAQIVFEYICSEPTLVSVTDKSELSETKRGDQGFGGRGVVSKMKKASKAGPVGPAGKGKPVAKKSR